MGPRQHLPPGRKGDVFSTHLPEERPPKILVGQVSIVSAPLWQEIEPSFLTLYPLAHVDGACSPP